MIGLPETIELGQALTAEAAAAERRPRPHGVPVVRWGGNNLTRATQPRQKVAMLRTRLAGETFVRVPVAPAVAGQPLPTGVNYDEGIILGVAEPNP